MDEGSSKVYYLPHHPVIKQESLTTKTRVVFDGSHKTTTGNSLNDELLVGPVIQDELFHIILRFRSHNYVITADIAMMYRQILVTEEDRNLQRILWKGHLENNIQIFTLNTVTYGTSAAPYLATRCLKQLAEDDGKQYKLAKEALLNDFYMDDVVTGTDTIEEAIELQKQLDQLLQEGKFALRKWRTNNEDILRHLTKKSKTQNLLVLNTDEVIKILRLLWNSTTDTIHFKVKFIENDKVTKRSILSQIVQIFDPLGVIGPVTIKAKAIMQDLWKLQVHWDEGVPQNLYTEWLHYRASLQELNKLKIPRNVNSNHKTQYIDIHGFCDASEKAYGACIYVSSRDQQGMRNTKLLCAKARVAPLKTITLPRLELCGAALLAKLVSVVEQASRFKIQNIYLWSDSTIVLSWINTDPHLLKTFVANRVTEIKRLTSYFNWRHVNSEENPADVISRGETAEGLISNKLWWNGPQWLQQSQWPEQKESYEEPKLERKMNVTLVTQKKQWQILTRYSSWGKLQRVMEYCLRFIHHIKKKNRNSRYGGNLAVEELDSATETIIRQVQEESYAEEIQDLQKNKNVRNKSKLISLHPYLDDKDLLRVGGRIHHSEVPTEQKHPSILPAKHHVTTLILTYEHKRAHHCGPEQLLAIVRTKFWPIAGRQAARFITRNCFDCFRYKPRNTEQLMGNLPAQRVSEVSRPFTICGIDYAGPIQLREHKRRGRLHLTKAYFAIFVCFSTKAVHLELVSELTTDAFLASLRRFVARRGLCKEIHSDNATNFVGATRQLKDVYDFLQQNNTQIEQDLAARQIKWHFLPPRSPHMGGLWEATVKSTKRHFFKVTKTSILTYKECYTLLTEIEAILNSRPLTPLSSDPNDYYPLTPAHFLVGDSLLAPLDNSYPNLPDNKLTRWQYIQRLKQHFWRRWHKEYLHQLQQRTRWTKASPNVKGGTLVVLVEDNVPPLRWPMGRIIQSYPGADGVVRVILVRTSHGTYKRPVTKVCVVPSECDSDPSS